MHSEQGPDQETALVPRLLVGLVSAVCRRPVLVLTAGLLLCAASLVGSYRGLEYHTQRADLISPQKDCQQRWRQYLAEFGDDDDMVVVVQGADRPRMREALETLAGKVRDEPGLFDRLFYKVDLRHLRSRALLFLPAESIKPIQDNVKSMHLLLDFGPWSWRSLGLLSMLREARHRAEHIVADQPLRAPDAQFLGQLAAMSRSAAATVADPARYQNPWGSLQAQQPQQQDLLAEPQYFFSGDGSLAFLLVRPVKEQGSFTAAHRSVDRLRDIVAEVRPSFPQVDFGLTGLPVLETDEMVAAERDTRWASWLAIGCVTLLFFAVYRSLYYPLLTVLTLLVGTCWALGWTTLTVGHLNILSATFAVMLIGMGDYGVLWVMRYEGVRSSGATVREALLHTTTHVAVGNLTAAATLALAFYAAMLADFQAVAELGWIAGSGVLLCALACFTVLPALLILFDRRSSIVRQPLTVVHRRWSILREGSSVLVPDANGAEITDHRRRTTDICWLPWLAARSRWVVGTGVALVILAGTCAFGLTYDHNLLHLQARDLESVRWELKLIEHTAGASWHALSYTSSPEEALALKARYEQLPEVSRVVEVASLVPRDQDRKMVMLKDIHQRLGHLPQRGAPIPHARPSRADVDAELACLMDQLKPLAGSVRQPLLAELQHNLAGLRERLATVDNSTAAERLQHFDERLAGDLAEDLHRLRGVSEPTAITVADLPPALRERYLGRTGKWLLRVFAKECLWDFEPLEHFAEQIQTVDPDATGKPFATVEGLTAMKNGFQRAGLYALAAIVLVLLIDFRSLHLTLLALAPLALGIVLTLGVLVLAGVPLNPANMIAFPLILGVGVDNGVHVLHDYLIRRREGLATVSYAIGRGVLVKALTAMIGFGALMISTQRGLVGLGFILALGVGCCMMAALVFLPAVLHMLGTRPETTAAEEPVVQPIRQAA